MSGSGEGEAPHPCAAFLVLLLVALPVVLRRMASACEESDSDERLRRATRISDSDQRLGSATRITRAKCRNCGVSAALRQPQGSQHEQSLASSCERPGCARVSDGLGRVRSSVGWPWTGALECRMALDGCARVCRVSCVSPCCQVSAFLLTRVSPVACRLSPDLPSCAPSCSTILSSVRFFSPPDRPTRPVYPQRPAGPSADEWLPADILSHDTGGVRVRACVRVCGGVQFRRARLDRGSARGMAPALPIAPVLPALRVARVGRVHATLGWAVCMRRSGAREAPRVGLRFGWAGRVCGGQVEGPAWRTCLADLLGGPAWRTCLA